MPLMLRTAVAAVCCALAVTACAPAGTPSPPATSAVVFEGGRIVTGGDGPPIEDGAFVVEGGRFTQVGPRSALAVPSGAATVDLRGRTVMPALIDLHSHLGYTNVRTGRTAASEYSRDTLVDHLQRYAYYGIAATLSLGLDRGELPYELRADAVGGAARFLTAGRGIAMPNAGPNAEHWRDAAYGVTSEDEARAAVRELAAREVDMVKIWVDDRNRTVTPLPPALYGPIIDEAHARGLRVVAHVYYLADAKALLRAGIDGFAHGIRDRDVDDEILALFAERPEVFVIPNLPDTPPATSDLDELSRTLLPARVADLRAGAVDEPARPALFQPQARSLARLAAAGVRIGFGTDAGVGAPYGWSAHTELADMVAAGMTPAAVLRAATRTSAEILGLDGGQIASGRSADFVVLEASPLDDITATRRIDAVYLRGEAVDREALARAWTAP